MVEDSPIGRRRWRRPPVVAAILSGAAALIAVTVTVAVVGGTPFGADLVVRDLVAGRWSEPGDRIAAGVSLLGTGPVLYPVLLALCLVGLVRQRSARELLPVLILVAGQVLALVTFAPLHRPVPADAGSPLLTNAFSSGRTAAAVLGWGLIAWQAGRLWWPVRRPVRRVRLAGVLLWTIAVVAGLVVGTTRVYLGLAWLSDAVAGIVTGTALLAVALAGLGYLHDRRRTPPRGPPAGPVVEAPAGPAVRPPAGLGHWLRSSPWAWCLPAGAALVPIVPILLAPPERRLIDMLVYHGAGGTAAAGENLYAFQTMFAMPFTYPPFAALVLEPIARMPLGVAQTLWTLATLAGVVAIAATVLRPVAERIGLPLTIAAMLVSTPIRSHFRFGQVGVFLVLLVTLDLLRRRQHQPQSRGWSWRAGWGLGLASAIKLTPAVFLPWLVVTRQWRRLATTVLWFGGATLLGLVLLWPSSGAYLREAARDTSRFGANDIPGNQSVRGMLLRVLPEPAAERLWLVAAVLLVAIGTYQAWRCERSGNRLAAVGVLAALSVAVSPISWVHHLVWLAVPIAALAAAGRFRLVAGWFAVLAVSSLLLRQLVESVLPSQPYLAELVTDLPGFTAVAAVLLLPRLVGAGHLSRGDLRGRSRPAPLPHIPATPDPGGTRARR